MKSSVHELPICLDHITGLQFHDRFGRSLQPLYKGALTTMIEDSDTLALEARCTHSTRSNLASPETAFNHNLVLESSAK